MGFPDRLPIPAEVLEIAERLEGAGHETWCVGGAVRDNLLGHANKDFDLATAARPEEVRRLFRRTVPVGIEHGTVAVLDRNKRAHEVTTFRRDVKTDGRHAEVAFGVSLEDDLARRDFTINAIAYHPLRHEWRDPFDGAKDIEAGVIRAVGTAWHRFREDYLRILRALRFAARFGFEIEPATWKAAKACVAGLQHLSAERVREEWMRGIEGARRPSELIRLWERVGALGVWLPEVQPGNGERGTGRLRGNGERGTGNGGAWEGQLGTVDRFAARDPVLLTVYLSRDPVATLTRLKCSRGEIERARRVAASRGRLPDPHSAASVRRWMSAVGAAVDDLVAIAVAEGESAGLEAAVDDVRASAAPVAVEQLAISGNDLLELGVPKGPAIGEILRRLLDDVLGQPELNTREQLLDKARVYRTVPRSPFPVPRGGAPGKGEQ